MINSLWKEIVESAYAYIRTKYKDDKYIVTSTVSFNSDGSYFVEIFDIKENKLLEWYHYKE